MNLWAYRFLLWYICILMVQPQIRFTFLWPLRIANLSFILGASLHILSSMQDKKPLMRFGPATCFGLLLIFFATLSQNMGVFQISNAWNPYMDIIIKNSLLLIMLEALCVTVERVWAVQMTCLLSTLWWIKGGLRLSAANASFAGDRIMGAAVSMIDNPNSLAYMMCVFLPLYLYAYQQAVRKWQKWSFLACALAAVWIVFESGSRTGLLTLIVMGAFLTPYYARHHLKGLVFISLIIALIYPLTGETNMRRFRSIPDSIKGFLGESDPSKNISNMTQDEQSAWERSQKNADTWRMIKDYFFFGVGVNPSHTRISEERYIWATGEVHCEILMAGRQMGLIGMSLYLGFLITIFAGGRWVFTNYRKWPAIRDLGWTFQVQAVALIVGGSFSPSVWNPAMMIMAGSASALVGVLKREKEMQAILSAGI